MRDACAGNTAALCVWPGPAVTGTVASRQIQWRAGVQLACCVRLPQMRRCFMYEKAGARSRGGSMRVSESACATSPATYAAHAVKGRRGGRTGEEEEVGEVAVRHGDLTQALAVVQRPQRDTRRSIYTPPRYEPPRQRRRAVRHRALAVQQHRRHAAAEREHNQHDRHPHDAVPAPPQGPLSPLRHRSGIRTHCAAHRRMPFVTTFSC